VRFEPRGGFLLLLLLPGWLFLAVFLSIAVAAGGCEPLPPSAGASIRLDCAAAAGSGDSAVSLVSPAVESAIMPLSSAAAAAAFAFSCCEHEHTHTQVHTHTHTNATTTSARLDH
jgi:hypothetical protein